MKSEGAQQSRDGAAEGSATKEDTASARTAEPAETSAPADRTEPADTAGAAAFKLGFKYFQRVEGTFRVSPKAKVESVQVRVYEGTSTQPRATHLVTLG